MNITSQVIHSLKSNPDEWKSDEHNLTHRSPDIEIWIANSFMWISIKTSKKQVYLNFKDKLLIWFAYKKWSMLPIPEANP